MSEISHKDLPKEFKPNEHQRKMWEAFKSGEVATFVFTHTRKTLSKYYRSICNHDYEKKVLVMTPHGKFFSEVCWNCRDIRAKGD